MPKTPFSRDLPKYVSIRSGQWHVRRTFATPERDERGRIVYLQISRRCVPETFDAAEQLALAIEHEFNRELEDAAAPTTVERYLQSFLRTKRTSVERRTYEYYLRLFERYVEGTEFAALPLANVKALDVQEFYAALQDAGAAAVAVRKVHTLLSMAFNQAVKWDEAARNPCRGAVLPKARAPEVAYFDQAQARAFVEATYRLPEYLVLHFALETGMRPGEYLALRWSDVDLARRVVRVSQAVTVGLRGGGMEIKPPKTEASRRTVAISERLAERLAEHRVGVTDSIASLERIAAEPLIREHKKSKGVNYQKRAKRRRGALAALKRYRELDLVFPAAHGGVMSRENLNRREFVDVMKAAGLRDAGHSLYSLRHTCATLMLAVGVDVKTIAEKLGHSDATQVLRTYAHVLPAMQADSLAKLEASIY